MLLKNLISNQRPEFAKLRISGISFDSRLTKKGNLFVSIKGNKFDGNDYVNDAISKGAKVIFYSGTIKKSKKVLYIKVKDTRKTLAELSTKYYKDKPKNIIAVTGTNGKTSVSDFFCQIINLQKKQSGFIGTLGLKANNLLKKRTLTTLDSLTLNKDLEELKKKRINNVIIEASSHGLKQRRLDFLKIRAGIFTNLSHDHLDYHKSMGDYLRSKLFLFNRNLKKGATIITDSDIKQYKLLKNIKKKRDLKILTIGSKSSSFKILRHKIFKNFQVLEIKYKNSVYKLKINLFGSIQVKNLLMSILAANICGCKIKNILNKIEKVKSVNGRLELIRTLPNKSKVFLDFAHTPDALKIAINSLREHFQKKITVVFGCGGERDKKKRKKMGEIAKKYCDKIFVTDDNPRSEKPEKIRKEIMKGLKNSQAKEIGDRKKAIIYALKNSDPNEVILIAGKGHETFQDLAKKKIFLSDKKIIKNFKSKNLIMNNQINNNTILKKTIQTKRKFFFDGVSINSKKIKNNNLFIAIKGKRKNGHDFLNESLKNGAKYCVVSDPPKRNSKYIKVNNTLNFLNKFAKNKRSSSSAKFIAVTGSSGKTTVKTLLGDILKKYAKTYFSPLSYNNKYGVPLSICNMQAEDDFGVFEVGMNKFNEIQKLSSIVKPHIGIITNISEAHLENFKNTNGIAKAKSEIIYNIQKEGTLILNRDDKFFNFFKKIANKNKINVRSFGYSNKSDVKFISLKKKRNQFFLKSNIDKKIFILKINNSNKSNIMNILCSLAVISELDLNLNKLKSFFQSQDVLKGRGKINLVKKLDKKFFLIDESYNANPSSVKSAIENFSSIQKRGKRKYFFFGDMLELGKHSEIYHKRISKLINKSDIDKTFVFGNKTIHTFKNLKKPKRGEIVRDLKSFKNTILKVINNGDYLMIKGSNGTRLHEVSNEFLRGASNAV